MRALLTALFAVVAAAALLACGDDDDAGGTTEAGAAGCAEVEAPEPRQVQVSRPSARLKGPVTAVVQTSCGDFEIALDTERAPKTTASFGHLVEEGFYDGLSIHRVEPGFVIQGGDPAGNGAGGPGYSVDEAPPPELSYTRGIVAMAKSAAEPPGRSGSQFFIVTAPADAGLPPDYALVGEVSAGMETVERIDELGTPGGQPSQPVVIESITLSRG